jgi:hypothetical protein
MSRETNRRISAQRGQKPADARCERDARVDAWHAAQREAVAAYRRWCEAPGTKAYAAYRMAQDEADWAQDRLAEAA